MGNFKTGTVRVEPQSPPQLLPGGAPILASARAPVSNVDHYTG